MGKSISGGKSENITIRCSQELKEKAMKIHAAGFSEVPFNAFLGLMIMKGLDMELEQIVDRSEKQSPEGRVLVPPSRVEAFVAEPSMLRYGQEEEAGIIERLQRGYEEKLNQGMMMVERRLTETVSRLIEEKLANGKHEAAG